MYPSAIAFGHINGEMSAIQQSDTATHRSRGLFSLVILSCADPLQSEPSSGWPLASFSRMGGKEVASVNVDIYLFRFVNLGLFASYGVLGEELGATFCVLLRGCRLYWVLFSV